MKYRVYVSASTQDKNIGVEQYGTEQDNMQLLADRIGLWLKSQRKFTIFRNKPGWSLSQTVKDCNNLACDLFFDNHSNAGSPIAQGTEVYYTSEDGKKFATAVYNEVAPISPGVDRGIKHDSVLYDSGLYVLRNTVPPSFLIEHFFHSNSVEVIHFLANVDTYAKATAKGICKAFDVRWEEPENAAINTDIIVDKMVEKGVTTCNEYWKKVLSGKEQVNLKYLNILIARMLNKI
jgi:N-acetylmuramoyl-L-alanine amidase